MNSSNKIDIKQLLWGAAVGVVTVGLMGISYNVGLDKGKEESQVLGEEAIIEEREVYIAVKSDCSDYESGTYTEENKEVEKYCVDFKKGKTAFEILKTLQKKDGDFTFDYKDYDFGPMIASINHFNPDVTSKFWAFLVNGEMSMVGVGGYEVKEGDELGFRVEEVEL